MTDASQRRRRRVLKRVRRVWIVLGSTAGILFVIWSLIAYRASGDARAAARTDRDVTVTLGDRALEFSPARETPSAEAALLVIPGALVDPVAYAPLARAVARAGFRAVIVRVPRRGALGGAEDAAFLEETRALLRDANRKTRWVLAGHSRGAVVASSLAAERLPEVAGLILMGTTHPRDVDLSDLTIPVAKIVGSRDGVARLKDARANRHLLPDSTEWIEVLGANHSSFGWYGFQPFDRVATAAGVTAQRRHMLHTVLGMLHALEVPPWAADLRRMRSFPPCYRLTIGAWAIPKESRWTPRNTVMPELIVPDSMPFPDEHFFGYPWRRLVGYTSDPRNPGPVNGMWRAPLDSFIVSFSGGFGGLQIDLARTADSLAGRARITMHTADSVPTAPASAVAAPCTDGDP